MFPYYGPTLEVLRYVCKHMGPAWADPLLASTAQWLEQKTLHGRLDCAKHWQMVLYLGRKLKDGLPHRLGEMVAVRRERSAALAGVFFQAGQLAQESGHSPSGALCAAMGRLPSELRRCIAFQAHLVLEEPACPL